MRLAAAMLGIKITHIAPEALGEDRAVFPDCPGEFLLEIDELHYCKRHLRRGPPADRPG